MKRAVIADMHLTARFDPKLFRLLSEIITDADEVIINGDFWEEDLVDLSTFQKVWQNLLVKLAATKTVLIAGNHDTGKDAASKCWFAEHVLTSYGFTDGGKSFHIEHGHIYDSPSKVRSLLKQPLLTPVAFANRAKGWLLARLFPFKSPEGRRFDSLQLQIREKIAADIVIFSHSHIARALPQGLYNTGCMMYGFATWLEIEDGQVALRKRRY